MYKQSPIETLASFALAFAAGALSAVAIATYGKWMRHRVPVAGQTDPQ